MNQFGMCGLLINGVPLDTYEGAALLDYTVGETAITNETFQGINRSTWHLLKSIFGTRQIKLTIVFTGPSRREVSLQRSKLNSALFGASELYISDDGFFYDVVCESCGASYHVVANPPRSENVCDSCGGALVIRKDDVPETVRARLQIFHRETEPLKSFYAEHGILKLVNGNQPIDKAAEDILAALGI